MSYYILINDSWYYILYFNILNKYLKSNWNQILDDISSLVSIPSSPNDGKFNKHIASFTKNNHDWTNQFSINSPIIIGVWPWISFKKSTELILEIAFVEVSAIPKSTKFEFSLSFLEKKYNFLPQKRRLIYLLFYHQIQNSKVGSYAVLSYLLNWKKLFDY